MPHQCTCDKGTTALCVQAVGTCQALNAKTYYLDMQDTFYGIRKGFWGIWWQV